MPSNPNHDLLYALKRFVQTVQPKNSDGESLVGSELSAGHAVLSAIEQLVDARVQAAVRNIPQQAAAIVADRESRTPR
jgi:hypothetical protein